ncbi:MAG: glycosyltransferase family 4 protein [Candidatus Binataceae bacterium]
MPIASKIVPAHRDQHAGPDEDGAAVMNPLTHPHRSYRLACVLTHPIQYQSPLFKYLAADPAIELTVFFLSKLSLNEYYDAGFGTRLRWDVPLLNGFHHVFLPSAGAGDALTFWRPLVYGLRRNLAAGRFDALWVHGYAHQGLLRAILTAKTLGLGVLLRGESQLADEPASPARHGLKRALLTRLFRIFDGFLAIGTRNREYYLSYGVPERRIFTMPYAVDNEFFRDGADRASGRRDQLRAELKLEPGRAVILYASKLQRHKRPGDLLEAFAQLIAKGTQRPNPYLLFVGDGAERMALEARAHALPAGAVRFLGFRNQTELPAYFDLCDVFVLASEHEPWGLIINEVMNAAKPVIASDRAGAAADLIINGDNGFVFPAGNIAALRDCLLEVLGDPARAARMGARSRARMAQWDFRADRDGLLRALAFIRSSRGQSPCDEGGAAPYEARAEAPGGVTTAA